MRIALAAPYSWPEVRRGGERYLHDLAGWLSAAGHDVVQVTGTGRRVHRWAARRGLTPVDTFGLAAWAPLLRARCDVVHALVPSAALAARATGRPTLYTMLGLPTVEHFGRRPFDRQLFEAAVRRSQLVTALSPAAAAAVRAVVPAVAPDAVRVLPPGVRTDRFPPEPAPRTGPPRLLFPADASDPRKGLGTALAALDLVLDRLPATRLLVAGPGDPSTALAGASERVRAAVDVLGVGQLTEVPQRYRAATLTLLPARYEAFGLVLVESLASGTPAVALAEGGPLHVLDDPATGRLAPVGDVVALADAVVETVELAGRPGTPQRCAERASAWGWDATVGPAHEAVYAEVLANRRTSGEASTVGP
ncbi:MAG TPA: glycosyltransferase family 4 protein [Mycobacteriales bacterium]|nr:glycosyltransferase family 4 protein [Mycobacteriales bacterium]